MHAWLLITFLLWLGMSAAFVGSAKAEPRLSGLPGAVQVGERIDIAWSDLPSGTHEVELEVSIEGGAWRRISPELEAREGHFVWRVPASMNGSARVRLRFGGLHREEAAAASEPFMIEGIEPSGPNRLGADEGWSGRGGIGDAPPAECVKGVPRLSVALAQLEAELRPRSGFSLQAPRCAASRFATTVRTLPDPTLPARTASPFTPLRN